MVFIACLWWLFWGILFAAHAEDEIEKIYAFIYGPILPSIGPGLILLLLYIARRLT